MNSGRVLLDARMTLREIPRSPLTVTLLFAIPLIFFAVVAYTTSIDPVVFGLPAISDATTISVNQRHESLVVIGSAAVGFLAAFLMMTVMQRNAEAHRRLILSGQPVTEVLLANIDAGWLQNPVYYSNAPNSEFIRILPAFYPVQAAIIGSFTEYSAWGAILRGVLYSVGLGEAAFLAYALRMRVHAPSLLGHALQRGGE